MARLVIPPVRSSIAPRALLSAWQEGREDPRPALGAEGLLREPRAELRRLLDRPFRDRRAHSDPLDQLPIGQVAEEGDEEFRDGGSHAVVDPYVGGQRLLHGVVVRGEVEDRQRAAADRPEDAARVLPPRHHHASVRLANEHAVHATRAVAIVGDVAVVVEGLDLIPRQLAEPRGGGRHVGGGPRRPGCVEWWPRRWGLGGWSWGGVGP